MFVLWSRSYELCTQATTRKEARQRMIVIDWTSHSILHLLRSISDYKSTCKVIPRDVCIMIKWYRIMKVGLTSANEVKHRQWFFSMMSMSAFLSCMYPFSRSISYRFAQSLALNTWVTYTYVHTRCSVAHAFVKEHMVINIISLVTAERTHNDLDFTDMHTASFLIWADRPT